MKRNYLISKWMIACFLIFGTQGLAFAQNLPLIDGKKTVATVNDEPITLEEFNRTIQSAHTTRAKEMTRAPGTEKKKPGRINYANMLDRMINKRLLLLEAKNIGIDELPEIRDAVTSYSKKALMELLLEQHVKDLKADGDEVERIYREIVKEWKIKALQFKKKADAKKIEAELAKADGNNFDAVASKAVAEKIAEGGEVEYLKDKDLLPSIARLVSKMEVGSISPIISIDKHDFILFKFEGIHIPETENLEAKDKAIIEALNAKRVKYAKDYYSTLRQKYLKLNEKLFKSLDYESKEPGIESLLKDERVIAEISGEKPVTVGDLSQALKAKYFHGLEKAIEGKKVNIQKKSVLESILEKRVLLKEALIQGIDKTGTYKDRVKDYENSLVFGAFLRKVVVPEIKLNPKEIETYYQENRKKYLTPQMLRIKELVFEKRDDAVAALDKLVSGTDFNWMGSHAQGQVDKSSKGILSFEGRMLLLNTMPEDVQKVVSNANPGDYRLYASPEGYFYVLYIYHVVAPKQQPFNDVKKEIAKTVYNDKLLKAIRVYADKLKEYYPVKIFSKDLRK